MPASAIDFIADVSAASAPVAIVAASDAGSELTLIVAENLARAEILAEDAAFFSALPAAKIHHKGKKKAATTDPKNSGDNGGGAPRLLSLPPQTGSEAGAAAFDSACDMLAVVANLRNRDAGARFFLACTPESLRCPVASSAELAARELVLRVGDKKSMREVAETLADFDYDNEALCEAPGQFSVRGGLLDVYPLNAPAPVRVDFFGDEIECLREFDPTTQRSLRKLDKLVVAAGTLTDTPPERAGKIFDYFPAATRIIFVEPESIDEDEAAEILAVARERNFSVAAVSAFSSPPEWLEKSLGNNAVAWDSADLEELTRGDFSAASLGVERIAEAEEFRRKVFIFLDEAAEKGEKVLVVCESEGARERLCELLAEEKKSGRIGKNFSPEILIGNVASGFRIAFSSNNGGGDHNAGLLSQRIFGRDFSAIVVATEREIFGRNRRRISALRSRLKTNRSRVEQLLDFSELVDGDYLVHLQHGICIYRGIKTIARGNGEKEDFLALEFENKVTLYVPFREAHLISRYIGLRKAVPKLGKVGSSGWEKTRKEAEKATLDFAAELLGLQAKRATRPGFAALPDSELPWLGEFEKAFPFTETPDQARAIFETKRDQEKSAPMDRLICGDVGFGKTEVAIRAAFKAVLSGCQVAILAPTTVLAQQHFNTFRDRFAHYPVSIEMLSRFRTPTQRKKIAEQIASGDLDIVIGTHALLSNSVKFKNLGLLVIDEEHRFGVKQKEKIKRLRENVDVLAMSATPIPRTLYLALMGARDLSVIETAPRERLPIQTIVRTYDVKLVKDAIEHEIARGGQVFYLHNRVETIHEVATLLHGIVPKAKIAVGHGQMDEADLERVMTDFVAGTFDVLVCTTIVETGLDIPNCNTIIIEGADRFGLGQLYQLRGRVGRFNRQAYAYLLLHRHRAILDVARKRLSAMKQFNKLGAGFRIAMRDLELRGAGNLLGVKQSGHVAGVGFELYCRLLRQSIAGLKGESTRRIFRAEINLDFVHYSAVPESGAKDARSEYQILKDEQDEKFKGDEIVATIPAEYIGDVRVRIDAFRRLAMAGTPDEVHEAVAAMEDRFGPLPPEAKAFCDIAEIRCIAEERGVVNLETEAGRIKARRPNGEYVKVGVNFPRLEEIAPLKRLRELRAFLLKI